MRIGLVALLLISSVPVNAHEFRRGYVLNRTCFKETYREQYVAGTRASKGHVKSFASRVEVPCSSIAKFHHHHHHHHHRHRQITSYNYSRARHYQPVTTYRVTRAASSSSACRSSRAAGSVLGGSLAAAVSKKDSWGWTIPLGAVMGLGIGDSNC